MRQAVHRVITRQVPEHAGLKGGEAGSGTVTVIQRFGSAANLNIHLLCLVPDRVFRRGAYGVAEFVTVPAPINGALQSVLQTIITRMMTLLIRWGYWSTRRARRTYPTTSVDQMTPAC